ncbi:type II 3-dehydroquinate dehydratase [Microbacterium halophytorum]|uniref:type II 3-dehydroquinate dehydratase n=1 Tax=Microbacterium halophytorum TaxID=2067568 RepID=UPI000CFBBC90|nr:type II 3-dehydroquinate dehydratase [Microbacterium halophytorum]
MTRKLYVLNGPNLDMLGVREPAIYGTTTLADIERECSRVAEELGFDLCFAQSNAEHEIIGWLHDAYRDGAAVVINPAGLSFRSVPVLDALRMLAVPIVELHITNIHGRDAEHRHSLMSPVATTVIAGAGAYGYELAIRSADHSIR